MKTWIEALQDFNKGSPMWSIPRKNTSNHDFVMRIMKGTTKVGDKVQLIEKKSKHNRTSMTISL